MNLILTMAGKYQRFMQEGYKIPKYLLPWGDKSILSSVLFELNKEKVFENVFLIANHRDEPYFPHLRAIMSSQNIPHTNLVAINDTKGQAETAMAGIKEVYKRLGPENNPVLFHNIDTILINRDFNKISSALKNNSGFIDIFSANNHEYSYVLAEPNGLISEIAEKIVVSNLATSGLYGFHTIDIFKKYYMPEDIYISSIFKRMIDAGEKVIAGDEHRESDTIVLGTPYEYMNAASTILM